LGGGLSDVRDKSFSKFVDFFAIDLTGSLINILSFFRFCLFESKVFELQTSLTRDLEFNNILICEVIIFELRPRTGLNGFLNGSFEDVVNKVVEFFDGELGNLFSLNFFLFIIDRAPNCQF
jgi:hypothetical protein